MNILLLASHAVAEYDDLRMLTDLGYDVFAPGGYEVPSRSGEGIRPALPDAPHHPELVRRLNDTRSAFRSPPGPYIDWGKARLHDDIIDWADTIICHHFPDVWIGGQWPRIAHKRVIWRTCGQSDPSLEWRMQPFVKEGLQVVRYSPREKVYFESVGAFAGEDAVIRFGKYPDDYGPYIGSDVFVGNVTQDMVNRGESCGLGFWLTTTQGLPVKPAGPRSEGLPGGIGTLPYDAMLEYLRHIRVYLYTGTRPASYTLGLIEAMLSGVPIVAMPASEFQPSELYEADRLGHDELRAVGLHPDPDLRTAPREALEVCLRDLDTARIVGEAWRTTAINLFGIDRIGAQWKAFLG